MTKRVSCGFSFRVDLLDFEDNMAHRAQFALGPRNCGLISADTRVWPVPDSVDRLIQDAKQAFWNPLGLACTVEMLLDACLDRGISVAGLFPVCLTVSAKVLAALVQRFGPGYFDNAQGESDLLSHGWRLVGLDTVELNGLTSGLKGIGYKEPSWSQFREQFGGALNEVGLFSDEATAAEFAKVRGVEIPSHAPFDVVGVLVHDPISQ